MTDDCTDQLLIVCQLAYADFSLDVDIRLPGRGVTAIYGHSGSGKTSLLRFIAGLEPEARGQLCINGEHWHDEKKVRPVHQRSLGYVFQEASLFPHLNVQDNLSYALKRSANKAPAVSFAQVVEWLGIQPLLTRQPQQLSGGERQRVAIARALLIQPRLLLMDEPMAALDVERRQEILPYLERLRTELDIPMLYVSHSADEVAHLADHLLVLEKGRVVAEGPLGTTLSRLDFPPRLADEIGVVLEAVITERDTAWKLVRATFDGGEFWLRDSGHEVGAVVRLRILARDISLALAQHKNSSILNLLSGKVDAIRADDAEGLAMVRLLLGNTALVARITLRSLDHLKLVPGATVWLQIKSVAVIQ